MHSTILFFLLAFATAVRSAPLPLSAMTDTSCPPNNEYFKIVCDGETHWSVCNFGSPVSMGLTAAGTVCQGGAIVDEATGETLTPAAPIQSPTSQPISSVLAPTNVAELTTLSSTTVLATSKSTSIVLVTLTRAESSPQTTVATVVHESLTPLPTTLQPTTSSTTVQETSPQPTTTHTTTVVEILTTTMTRPASAIVSSISGAAPSPSSTSSPVGSSDITADQITLIAPSSSSCSGAEFADECATSSDAAPFINDAFNSFGITTQGEKAALLSLMAYESGEFKYNINHFPSPGTPGQGTRNMMMFPFILKYAQSIPSLAASIPAGTTTESSSDAMNTVRALVLDGAHTFATAAWFYSTQCSADVKAGVQSGSEAGWAAYITGCVGTTAEAARQTYWTNAMSALQ